MFAVSLMFMCFNDLQHVKYFAEFGTSFSKLKIMCSPEYYLDECPYDALSQVDPCTWTSD